MTLSKARLGRRAGLRAMVVLLVLALIMPFTAGRCGVCQPPPAATVWHSYPAGSAEDKLLTEGLKVIAAEGSKISLTVTAQGEGLGAAIAAAAGKGDFPDIIIAPAEWAPTLDRAQATYRLPLETADDWLPALRTAVGRQGQLLALPLYCETIALGRAGTAGDDPWPATVAQLATAVAAAERAGQGSFFWPADDLAASLPFYYGAGGSVEPSPAAGADPIWDAPPVVSAVAVSRWLTLAGSLAGLAGERISPPSVTDWQQGAVSFGPLSPTAAADLHAAGVAVSIGPLPEARSLLNTHVALVMRDAGELNPAAVDLIVRLMADGGDGLVYLSRLMGQLPPMASHFASDAVVASGLSGFKDIVLAAAPMPSGRYAAEVWALYETALADWRAGAKAEDIRDRLIEGVEQVVAAATGAP